MTTNGETKPAKFDSVGIACNEGNREKGGVNNNPAGNFIRRPPPPAAIKPTGSKPIGEDSATDTTATNASNSAKTMS